MYLCEIAKSIVNTNSPVYAGVSIAASIGTIIALGYTVHSVNESRKQNKKIAAKGAIDVIFKNIGESLEGLAFYQHGGPGGIETYFGQTTIYRLSAHPNYTAFCYNKTNYKIVLKYLEYFISVQGLLERYFKEIENEQLKKFYLDKLSFEKFFITEILSPVIDGCKPTELNTYGNKGKDLLESISAEIEKIKLKP